MPPVSEHQHGSGAVAIGPGAVAAGASSVAVGGSVSGNITVGRSAASEPLTSTSAPAAAQIFLCYARQDEDAGRELYQRLSPAGFKPWMDQEDIYPGKQRQASIERAIQQSEFFLACLSTHAVSRRGVLTAGDPKAHWTAGRRGYTAISTYSSRRVWSRVRFPSCLAGISQSGCGAKSARRIEMHPRVLRGGAFYYLFRFVRCGYRAGTIRTFRTGTSVFGWWCAQPFSFWPSGRCPSGLWGSQRGSPFWSQNSDAPSSRR